MAPRTILERETRLSRSSLWRLQRRFFAAAGVLAWSEGVVPHYVTGNPFIARAFAEVVRGWLRDQRAAIDPGRPVYVVELGAGSGRFGFQLLRRLARALAGDALAGVRLRVVLTDFVEANVAALRAHPSLRPFVAAGALDFAVFDAERDEELRLLESGEVLAPGRAANPVAVVANYFFDGLPHDVFRVEEGRLHEGLVTLAVDGEVDDPDDPRLLARVELEYTHRALVGPAYDDPELDAIVAGYASLPGRTSVPFPCAALRCLRALERLSGGRLLVLSGDRAVHRTEELLARPDPRLVRHGSVSILVNHEAIARFVRARGGSSLHASRGGDTFEVAAFILDPRAEALAETARAYEEAIESRGPDDFFAVKRAIERGHRGWSARELLAWVRLSGWDPAILLGFLEELLPLAAQADAALAGELRRTLERVWDAYFPIGEPTDLAFAIALLLGAIGEHAEALKFYERSLRLHGRDALTAYNMAACHAALGRPREALRLVEQALALDPGLAEAQAARARLTRALGEPDAP